MRKPAVFTSILFAVGITSCAQLGPVSTEPRAIVLLIDKSGSMREDNRLHYAKEAAKAVALRLGDNDFLGVVGFDVNPFVVVPLSRVGAIRNGFDADIERLKAGGRTYLMPALVEAKRQLEKQSAARKDLIILSDGETGGSGGDYIDLVHVMRTESNITVSAVAIGHDANFPLMNRFAQNGGGFFQHVYNPSALARIIIEVLDRERNSGQ